jgi:hypothetical protein
VTKFAIDVEPFAGQTYEYVPQDECTWAEASELEDAIGASLTDFYDADRGPVLRSKARTNVAFLWIAIRRVRPQTTLDEVAATPRSALRLVPDVANPTDAVTDSTTETSDESTSPPSPSTLESDRGNGST